MGYIDGRADDLRAKIAGAPRSSLPSITQAMWRAYDAGAITEAEAEALSAAVELRRSVPAAPTPRRHVGSRPRTPESLARRRRWAASGHLPPTIAARYTLAEQAVLAVVAAQVRVHGRCDWPIGRIAAIAGVAASTAKAALREARIAGHILSAERRYAARRSDTSIITIIAPEWVAWLRLHRRETGGGGDIFAPSTSTGVLSGGRKAPRKRGQRAAEDASRVSQRAIRRRRAS